MDDVMWDDHCRRMAQILRAGADRSEDLAGRILRDVESTRQEAARWECAIGRPDWYSQHRHHDGSPQPEAPMPPRPAPPVPGVRLTQKQREILHVVTGEWATCGKIAKAAGRDYAGAYQLLKALIRHGVVERRESSETLVTDPRDGTVYRCFGQVQVQYRRVPEDPDTLAHFAAELDGVGAHLIDLYPAVDREGGSDG